MPAPPAVRVRPTTEADLPDLVALWNDGRVMRWVGFPDGLGSDLEQARGWWERTDADPDRHHGPVIALPGSRYACAGAGLRRQLTSGRRKNVSATTR